MDHAFDPTGHRSEDRPAATRATRLGAALRAALTAVLAMVALTACGAPSASGPHPIVDRGPTMAGWEVVLGDALYAAPGEPPVTLDDIRTASDASKTTLYANIHARPIMAHNITTDWRYGPDLDTRAQSFATDVRLPYLPSTSPSAAYDPQTIEMSLLGWNGTTHVAPTCAVQWRLNPWDADQTALAFWEPDGTGGSHWVDEQRLAIDTDWHRWRLDLDPATDTCTITIDGAATTSAIGPTPKPPTWTSRHGASVTVEIISIYPGTGPNPTGGREHYAEFRNWVWTIDPP